MTAAEAAAAAAGLGCCRCSASRLRFPPSPTCRRCRARRARWCTATAAFSARRQSWCWSRRPRRWTAMVAAAATAGCNDPSHGWQQSWGASEVVIDRQGLLHDCAHARVSALHQHACASSTRSLDLRPTLILRPRQIRRRRPPGQRFQLGRQLAALPLAARALPAQPVDVGLQRLHLLRHADTAPQAGRPVRLRWQHRRLAPHDPPHPTPASRRLPHIPPIVPLPCPRNRALASPHLEQLALPRPGCRRLFFQQAHQVLRGGRGSGEQQVRVRGILTFPPESWHAGACCA